MAIGKKPRMSITTIARRSGYSLAHISKIFGGKRRPSLDAANKIAQAQGITIDALHKQLSRLA